MKKRDDSNLSKVYGTQHFFSHSSCIKEPLGWNSNLVAKGWQFHSPYEVELALRLLTRMRSDGVRPGAAHYTCLGLSQVHPRKLTWNLKMKPWKRRFLLETIIDRFHVSFRGGTCYNFHQRLCLTSIFCSTKMFSGFLSIHRCRTKVCLHRLSTRRKPLVDAMIGWLVGGFEVNRSPSSPGALVFF